jgi:hypothetical protein
VGRRSRKRPHDRGPAVSTAPQPARPPRRSSAERDEEARAQLEPLAPGERPGAVTVAAIVAFVLAAATLVLVATGYKLSTTNGSPATGIIQAAILVAAGIGMWQGLYWAVLGFEALLGITAIVGFLSLLVASNVWGALLALLVLTSSTVLFYKLIRAMARIQMPRRPTGAGRG